MKNLFLIALTFLTIISCKKEKDCKDHGNNTAAVTSVNKITSFLFEDFESGTKGSYASADVVFSSGTWNLNDALLGNSASDAKSGLQSVRMRNSGSLTMKSDYPNGAGTVTVKHAKYGTDANGSWQLWYSTNAGSSYTQTGATITTSTTTLSTANFTINVSGNIRLEIRKSDAGTNRINFDDITINDFTASNPAPALTSISPTSANSGSGPLTLTVTGSNFINSSVINWNGSALSSIYISSTQLSATIPSANLTTAGSAAVTVFNPAPGGGTTSAQNFTINTVTSGIKRFLFDATKAETAGNADWVIDEDAGVPKKVPTPAQSGITATTSGTYWTGAISSWGVELVKKGNFVETLPSGTAITYGGTGVQDLSHYDVFVVDEPNTRFTSAEKTAILNFVNAGGGLFMISDHTISDRNNDGWDSPDIWNDLMTNNSVQNNPFGFSVSLTNFSQLSNNVLTSSSSNPILNGTQGTVTQLEFNNGANLTLSPAANANVQGLIWKSGVTQNNSNVMCASSIYGSGRVFIVTDSSPMDDGTGASGNTLFVSWTKYSHAKLFMNASLWLAKLQ
ncbi:MAG: IPT/TIG domain-containing protein [Bacteroidota bacterium]